MDTIKLFIMDLWGTVSGYITVETLVPVVMGICLISAFLEWAGNNDSNKGNDD